MSYNYYEDDYGETPEQYVNRVTRLNASKPEKPKVQTVKELFSISNALQSPRLGRIDQPYEASELSMFCDWLATPQIYVAETVFFTTSWYDFRMHFRIKKPILKKEAIKDWKEKPLTFWQNQVNFAFWCATAGCGLSFEHFQKASNLTRSVLIFHVHFPIRRIMRDLDISFPEKINDFAGWRLGLNEPAFEQICREFGADVSQTKLSCALADKTMVASISLSDWEMQDSPPDQLWRNYWSAEIHKPLGTRTEFLTPYFNWIGQYYDGHANEAEQAWGEPLHLNDPGGAGKYLPYVTRVFQSDVAYAQDNNTIVYDVVTWKNPKNQNDAFGYHIRQGPKPIKTVKGGFVQFMPRKSTGFTVASVERLKFSILKCLHDFRCTGKYAPGDSRFRRNSIAT